MAVNSNACYRVIKVPGDKGMGAVAVKDLCANHCIVRERALVVVDLTEGGDVIGNFDSESGEFRSRQLESRLNSLSDDELRRFYSLTDVFTSKSNPSGHTRSTGKTNFGIIKTNSFTVTKRRQSDNKGDGEKGTESVLALFPSIARINHSCRPNCHHYNSGKTGEFVVRAVEEVSEGEELTISYMSPLQRADFHDRKSRRKILQEEFGFLCQCELCCRSNVTEDDRKRRRVLEIEVAWGELGGDPQSAMELGEEQFKLCTELSFQSGLLSYVALHCVEAASLLVAKKSSAEQHLTKAVKYANLASTHGSIAYGKDSEEAAIFRSVIVACKEESDYGLLGAVRSAIVKLRDI